MSLVDLAIAEAKKSNMECRLGAVIVDPSRRVYTGHNYDFGRGSGSCHAEMAVLEKCLREYRLLSLVRSVYKHRRLPKCLEASEAKTDPLNSPCCEDRCEWELKVFKPLSAMSCHLPPMWAPQYYL